MDKIKLYIGGASIAGLVLIPTLYLLFALTGAASGVVPVDPPVPDRSPGSPRSSRFPLNPEIDWSTFYYILLATVVISLTILAIQTFRRPKFGANYRAPLEQSVLEQEFTQMVQTLRDDPDTSRAIRLAFDAAETKIEHLPKRIAPETPFEWSSRVSNTQLHLSGPLDVLCSKYALARFAPEQATPQDRDAALTALSELKRLSDSVVVPVSPVPVLPWA